MTAIHYDGIAGEYHRNRRAHRAILSDLVEGACVTYSSRVLEVGCGTGNYIMSLAEVTGCRAYGIDPSVDMLAYAGQENCGRVVLERGTAEDLDFSNGFFDPIFSVDVIHHLSDRPAYLERARRQLAPTGHLCTVTDSEEIIRTREPLSRYFPETVAVELERYPPIARFVEELYCAGFKDIWQTASDSPYTVADLTPYREKAFSSLHLIPAEAHERGVARMAEDLRHGPIRGLARYCHVWARG